MRWEESNKASGEAGTTLVEVIIAMLILATGVMTMAQLFVASTATNMNSRKDTLTSIYAEQKQKEWNRGFYQVNDAERRERLTFI